MSVVLVNVIGQRGDKGKFSSVRQPTCRGGEKAGGGYAAAIDAENIGGGYQRRKVVLWVSGSGGLRSL